MAGPYFDVYNGRITKTPEYPNGTYAYFIPIDATGEEVFPYVIGRQYYGQVTSGNVGSITETVTTNFDINTPTRAGPFAAACTPTPTAIRPARSANSAGPAQR